MANPSSIVVFACKKCGEVFEAPVEKAGDLFSCPKCNKINKIPGIALQKSATKEQMAEIHKITDKIKKAFILFLIGVFVLVISMTVIKSIYVVAVGLTIILGCLYCLCYYIVVAKRHLSGRNSAKMVGLSFFFAFGLLLPIVGIPIFVKIFVNERRLLKVGLRED